METILCMEFFEFVWNVIVWYGDYLCKELLCGWLCFYVELVWKLFVYGFVWISMVWYGFVWILVSSISRV